MYDELDEYGEPIAEDEKGGDAGDEHAVTCGSAGLKYGVAAIAGFGLIGVLLSAGAALILPPAWSGLAWMVLLIAVLGVGLFAGVSMIGSLTGRHRGPVDGATASWHPPTADALEALAGASRDAGGDLDDEGSSGDSSSDGASGASGGATPAPGAASEGEQWLAVPSRGPADDLGAPDTPEAPDDPDWLRGDTPADEG